MARHKQKQENALNPVEKGLIIRHKVGIVYVTWEVVDWPGFLKLLLTKWKWLQDLEKMPRPFALFLNAAGLTSDHFKRYRLNE